MKLSRILSACPEKRKFTDFGRPVWLRSFVKRWMSPFRSCPPEELNAPGKVKCMVLIYEGTDAVAKIRTVLGPTDPTKAPDGTIRREFGKDVMVNTAHASDSQESYERETRVIKIDRNNMAAIIRDYLSNHKE